MDIDPVDEFERELRGAFERRPAPPSLKRRLMEKKARETGGAAVGYVAAAGRVARAYGGTGGRGGVADC